MKKTLVAVGVVVALGAVWAGSSWYIGKQLEGRMAEMVAKANNDIAKALPDSGLAVSYENYQRGTFSSQMQLVLKSATGAKSPLLPEGQSIIFDENIMHGPLPGLSHFSLVPALASVESVLAKNTTTQSLFEITQDKPLVNALTQVSFDGATSSVINIIPVNYNHNETQLTFSGSVMNADVDARGDKMKFSLNASTGSVKSIGETGQPVQVSFSGLSLSSDSQNSVADLRVGTQKAAVQNLILNIDGKEMASLNGFSISATTVLQADKKNIALQADYSLDALKAQNQNLGSGKLAIKLDNIDAQALSTVSNAYTQESQRLLADPEIMQDPDRYRQEMVDALAASFPLLLKGNPNLSVAPLSWKNAKGEATFNLSLSLKDPQQSDVPPDSVESLLGQYITTLDTRLVIPVDMAVQAMTQAAILEGVAPEEADKQAQQQVKGLAAMGQMFHLTKMEDNSITATLAFANDKATLNGEVVPLSDLFGALPLGMEGNDEDAPDADLPGSDAPELTPVVPEAAPQQ